MFLADLNEGHERQHYSQNCDVRKYTVANVC